MDSSSRFLLALDEKAQEFSNRKTDNKPVPDASNKYRLFFIPFNSFFGIHAGLKGPHRVISYLFSSSIKTNCKKRQRMKFPHGRQTCQS
jgi:hypothetical protein